MARKVRGVPHYGRHPYRRGPGETTAYNAVDEDYFGAATTVVVVLALYLLREFRARIIRRFQTSFTVLNVTFSETGGDISGVVETLERYGMEVRGLNAELEDGSARYTIQLSIPPRHSVQATLREIVALPGVRRVNVSGLQRSSSTPASPALSLLEAARQHFSTSVTEGVAPSHPPGWQAEALPRILPRA